MRQAHSQSNNQNSDRIQDIFEELKADASNFYSKEKVFDHKAYELNRQTLLSMSIPRNGSTLEEVIANIRENILPGAIHQHHKNYLAFPDKGSNVAAQYAAMLSSITNQNLIADEKSAPSGTYVEMAVIKWLRQLVGFADKHAAFNSALDAGGAFVPGGVLANTIALLAARQHIYPRSKAEGMQLQAKTPKVFVAGSTINHYSHFGAGWWLGLGTDNIITLRCDHYGRIDKDDLESKLQATIKHGYQPVAVIALAGDSRMNCIDDFPGLYKITQKYNVWLHADACHGGVMMFDQDYKHGDHHKLWYCDSLTIDPHKHLDIPYASSLVLFKNAQKLADIGSSTDITIAYGSADMGQVTPFLGSRPFDALKLYAAIHLLGVEGIKDDIARRQNIAKSWYDLLLSSSMLQPMHEPELFAVAFSLRPGGLSKEQLSACNSLLHDKLYRGGDVVVHKYKLCDYANCLGYGAGEKLTVLGVNFGSSDYSQQDLEELLKFIQQVSLSLNPS